MVFLRGWAQILERSPSPSRPTYERWLYARLEHPCISNFTVLLYFSCFSPRLPSLRSFLDRGVWIFQTYRLDYTRSLMCNWVEVSVRLTWNIVEKLMRAFICTSFSQYSIEEGFKSTNPCLGRCHTGRCFAIFTDCSWYAIWIWETVDGVMVPQLSPTRVGKSTDLG